MMHRSPIAWPSADFVDRKDFAAMSEDEDPYAVSSDSDDEKGPPPKIAIDREAELSLSQIKQSLAQDEHKAVKDERMLGEIEELRKTKAAAVKRDFEEGKVSTAEGAQSAKEEVHGLDRSTLGQFKDKFENLSDTLQQNMAEKMQAGATKDELEEIKSQVNEVKQKWRTGDLEGAENLEDSATRDELEALKGVNVKGRFQPGQGEFHKSYDRSELDTSGAADARKSFLEGSAFAGREVSSAAAGELSELKFTALDAYKDKFENGKVNVEDIQRARVELDLQLDELKQAFEKPESEMSPEERLAKKRAEIEAEFARYKLTRKLRAKQQQEEGGDETAAAGGAQAMVDDGGAVAEPNVLAMAYEEEGVHRNAVRLDDVVYQHQHDDVDHDAGGVAAAAAADAEAAAFVADIATYGNGSWSSAWTDQVVQQLLHTGGADTARRTRSAATASRQHRRRCRRGGGGGIRREESDEQIPQHRPDAEGACQQAGRAGGVACGGEESDQEVRAAEPGLGGGERGQAAPAGGGVSAAQGGEATGPQGVRGRDGRVGSARWRKRGNPGGGGPRVENGSKMGEDSRQGGQEGGEVEDAGRQEHDVKRTPAAAAALVEERADLLLQLMDHHQQQQQHHSSADPCSLPPLLSTASSSSSMPMPNNNSIQLFPTKKASSSSSSCCCKMLLIMFGFILLLLLLTVAFLLFFGAEHIRGAVVGGGMDGRR